MAAPWVLPLLAGLTGLVFAGAVALQWRLRRRPHQLAWAAGLLAYGAASLIDAWVVVSGWSESSYWVYLALASGNVGLLGVGTVYLLRMKGVGHALAALVAIGVALILVAPLAVDAVGLEGAGPEVGLAGVPKDGLGGAARLSFILLSSVGGVALIGGALWSWWQTRRAGVLLIGLGALVVASGGTVEALVSRWGTSEGAALDFRLLTQLVGIAVMFVGFLQSREAAPPRDAAAPARG